MIRRIAMSAMALTLIAGPGLAADEGWKGDLGLSFTQQSGTTETVSGTLDLKGERDWEDDEVDLRLLVTIGNSKERDNNTETTADSQAFFAGWKHTLSDRFFIDTRSEVSRDGTQDRDLRVALNTGPGVRVWAGEDDAKEHFDVSVGIGYRYEAFDGNNNVPTAVNSEENFVDVVAAFEYKNMLIEDRLEFTHTGSAKMPANDPNSYILRTELGLGVPLTESWDLRAGFLAEYIHVTTGRNKELTTRTTVGAGYKF